MVVTSAMMAAAPPCLPLSVHLGTLATALYRPPPSTQTLPSFSRLNLSFLRIPVTRRMHPNTRTHRKRERERARSLARYALPRLIHVRRFWLPSTTAHRFVRLMTATTSTAATTNGRLRSTLVGRMGLFFFFYTGFFLNNGLDRLLFRRAPGGLRRICSVRLFSQFILGLMVFGSVAIFWNRNRKRYQLATL